MGNSVERTEARKHTRYQQSAAQEFYGYAYRKSIMGAEVGEACTHRHKTERSARNCAQRMVAVMRNQHSSRGTRVEVLLHDMQHDAVRAVIIGDEPKEHDGAYWEHVRLTEGINCGVELWVPQHDMELI